MIEHAVIVGLGRAQKPGMSRPPELSRKAQTSPRIAVAMRCEVVETKTVPDASPKGVGAALTKRQVAPLVKLLHPSTSNGNISLG